MENNIKKIIIFGASKAGQKMFNILRNFNYKVEFFVDNDENKWDTMVCGKPIKSPKTLKNIDLGRYYIIIGSMFINDISNQLETVGLLYKINFDNMYNYTKMLIEDNINYFISRIKKEKVIYLNNKSVFMALPCGISLGGVETLSSTISNALNEKYDNTYLLNLKPREGDNPEVIGFKFKEKILDFYIDDNNYLNSLIEGCVKLQKYLPITIIPNHSEEVFLIANILKKIYPDFVKVISILHSISDDTYEKNINYSKIISKFICVSDEISNKFIKLLPQRNEDIITKISPVVIEGKRNSYSNEEEPLKIGFGGRLVKEAKRCDLLINLIDDLESREISYEIHIAGNGDYYNIINEFIIEKKLNNKVFLYGQIPNNKMNYFWRQMDVYINTSDFEGTSIAMLEALGNGCVPIVTNVSGVKKFISNGINGFVVEVGDFVGMANNIEFLYFNREKLYKFGMKCIDRVKEACSIEDYINHIYSII
ncbi:glycosyltransferase [Clostridium brassicae]|uniref:Glycosyltransferase n=1 Tax=Clostridium brassicae TaxID=2999072 RepID=A0ABT4DB99_9CLOT|nr:glycosyltransferase [Clostridium brassicae]MCY6959579.1 glycosyltransferase [Clostridium brassicae]